MDINKILELFSFFSTFSTSMLQEELLKILTALALPMLALAIINCFFGYRLFRIIVAISGAMIGAASGVMLGLKLQSTSWLIMAVIICVAAGGFAGYKLYMAGAFVMGFFSGMMVGAMAMVVLKKDAVLVVAVLAGLILGLLAVDLYKYVLVALTSINGGMLMGICILILMKKDNPKLMLMFGAVFTIIGMIVQYAYVFKHDRKKAVAVQTIRSGNEINEKVYKKDNAKAVKRDKMLNYDEEKAYIDDRYETDQNLEFLEYYEQKHIIPDFLLDYAENFMAVGVIISIIIDFMNTGSTIGSTIVNYPVVLFFTAFLCMIKKNYKMTATALGIFEISSVLYFLINMGSLGIIKAIIILFEIVCVGAVMVFVFKGFISTDDDTEPEYTFSNQDTEDDLKDYYDEKEDMSYNDSNNTLKLKKELYNKSDIYKADTNLYYEKEIYKEEPKDESNNTENSLNDDEIDMSEKILNQTKNYL